MITKTRWNRLVERLTGAQLQKDSFNWIVSAYSEPHRHYHTLAHIEQCLKEFDAAKYLCEAPDEVELALWLHDLVYDPHASDNEEKSAVAAKEFLLELNCPERTVHAVSELILFTKHNKPPITQDAKVILDIDLIVLGQPVGLFELYEKNIRAEYSWVSEEVYKTERTKVLRSFLDKASIYYTDRFEVLYGSQARENLKKTLIALEHVDAYSVYLTVSADEAEK
jgi:predicted metal-dependent HD superfamily phosphohydrolase